MRLINLRISATVFTVLTALALCSFVPFPGGDSYEVYLNNELLIKEHLYGRNEAPSLPLSAISGDELSVTFSHCGKIGTSRKISLKDDKNAILKEWAFADSPDIKNRMKIKPTEIRTFCAKHSATKLVYTSNEQRSDIILVSLNLTDASAKKGSK